MKYIATQLLLIGTFAATFAQGNFTFPSTYGEWVVYEVYPVIGPNDYYTVYRNFISGDTVFNGKTYSKTYSQNLCVCSICHSPVSYQPSALQQAVLIGGVREENGIVYWSKLGQGDGLSYFSPVIDTMLFNFNLEVNDTFDYDNTKFMVESITLEPSGRKNFGLRHLTSPPYLATWIEGIGSSGLFETTDWLHQNGSCFSSSHPSTCVLPCSLISDTEAPFDKNQIKVYPTVATEDLTIEFNTIAEQADVSVFAMDGRLLANYPAFVSGKKIPVDQFSSGILLVKITFENGYTFVKQVQRL